MSERADPGGRLVADRFRAAFERYRGATAKAASAYESAARTAEARLESERSAIEVRLDALTSMHDRVLAMADAAQAHPDVAQLGAVDHLPAPTSHESPPNVALRALHDSVAAHIAQVLPYAASPSVEPATDATAPGPATIAPEPAYASSDRTPTYDEDEDTAYDDEPPSTMRGAERDERDEDAEVPPRSGCGPLMALLAVLIPLVLIALGVGASLVREMPFLCSFPLIERFDECVRMQRTTTPQPSTRSPSPSSSTATPSGSSAQAAFCASGRWHTVAAAERLSAIALLYETTVDELVRLNRTLIQDVNLIRPGWRLCLP